MLIWERVPLALCISCEQMGLSGAALGKINTPIDMAKGLYEIIGNYSIFASGKEFSRKCRSISLLLTAADGDCVMYPHFYRACGHST